MLEKWRVSYPAHTGREPRWVYVYIPDSFDADNSLRYPVLYMFDGHNLFSDADATYGRSWGLKRYLDETQTQLMVVGVECNHDPKDGRLSEYAPFSFSDPKLGAVVGRGESTMQWFTQALKPLIDRQYPALSDRAHTLIGGSSMGGLMSLYAICRYNHVFGRAAALSPSLWCAPKQMCALAAQTDFAPGTVVYMDYGARELNYRKAMPAAFGDMAAQLLAKRVLITSRIVPRGEHSEASWEKQLPFMMQTLLYDLP